MSKKAKPAKPRDPSWRLRRALGAKRIDSAKAYKRADLRRSERDAGEGENGPENGPRDAGENGGENGA